MNTPTTLWNRNFTVWLLSSAQSQLGNTLSSLALSFYVLSLTGSAAGVALTLAFALLPGVLSPLAGALIDRVHLKIPLVVSDALRGALQLGLALAALSGAASVELVYAVAFLGGLIGVFVMPAASSAVPMLVPGEHLQRANGLMGSVVQGMGLLGLLLGGVLVGAVGPVPALLAAAASYLIMALAVGLLVQFPARVREAGAAEQGLWGDIASGLRLMRASRLLTTVPLIALLLNAAFAPLQALLPVVMERAGYGAQGYGTLMASVSGGMVLAGLLFAVAGSRLAPRATVAVSFALSAGALLVMAALPPFWGYLLAAVVLGLGFGLTNTPLLTLIGRQVPPSHLGRVFSVLGMAATLGMPLTLLLIAPLADRYPAGWFFGATAGVMLLMIPLWLWAAGSADEPAAAALSDSPAA